MPVRSGLLLGRVLLRFDPGAAHVPHDLSAVSRLSGGALALAGDERASLEILEPSAPQARVLDRHRSSALGAALGYDPDDELDIEGMSDDGEALWVVGSHSARRKKPKGKGDREDLERLATVLTEPSRFLLARVPLVRGRPSVEARISRLGSEEGEGSLVALLTGDKHLGPFLPASDGTGSPIPGKDNGFDIEGLALHQGRVLLGLRGPVLRGWAFILELDLAPGPDGVLVVKGNKSRYRKHALDLDGLGVRELVVRGDDVLILAGPTMALDGPQRVFRWKGGPGKSDSVVSRRELDVLFDLPARPGQDRAEGITDFGWLDESDALLVVYDGPGSERQVEPTAVFADVFAAG